MKYMLLIHSNPDAVAGRSEEKTLEVYAYIDDLHAQRLTGMTTTSGHRA